MKNTALFLVFFIVACSNSGSKTIKNSNTTTNQPEKIVSITDEQFLSDAIENDFELKNILTVCRDFNREIETIKNDYSKKFDTATVYYNNSDTVAVYSTGDKKFILKMNLNTSKIGLLRDTIKIGMDKKYFTGKFPSIKDTDIFKISTLEGYIYLQFTIKNDTL